MKPVIEIFNPGPWQTNCHLVYEEAAGAGDAAAKEGARACWIVDAGVEPGGMIERVRDLGLKPAAVVLTHGHIDHIAGVREVVEAFPGTPVWIHEAERGWLSDPEQNLSALLGMPVTAPGPDRLLKDGETLHPGRFAWKVLHVPGHSPGSAALYHEPAGVVISGDALFAGSVGRTDFPGCSFDVLEKSIREKLYTLPGETVVYPGHGPTTTIGRERKGNPFVRG